jgi:hypothetical protein
MQKAGPLFRGAKDTYKDCPLYLAVHLGYADILRLLLERDAELPPNEDTWRSWLKNAVQDREVRMILESR